uniref:Uncharacterized protein n=1 Tax=Glossina pallidipes TaxID=7398 RepID=A0A1A9ZK78_GLOPL
MKLNFHVFRKKCEIASGTHFGKSVVAAGSTSKVVFEEKALPKGSSLGNRPIRPENNIIIVPKIIQPNHQAPSQRGSLLSIKALPKKNPTIGPDILKHMAKANINVMIIEKIVYKKLLIGAKEFFQSI